MSPRPTPDLVDRRARITRAARELAESDGWPAVTMRRLADELGVTQPVLYTAFPGRQALVDAVALDGFQDLADDLHTTDRAPLARMRAYLAFAAAHPRTYEAMFSLPSELSFATDDTPEPLLAAFGTIDEVFPSEDGVRAELAWATLHGLATLQAGGRLPAAQAEARLALAHRSLARRRGSGS